MEAWLIILITVSVGVALFGIAFFLKDRKAKKLAAQTTAHRPHYVVSNSNYIPSTGQTPIFNMGNPQQTFQQGTTNFGMGYFNPAQMSGQYVHPAGPNQTHVIQSQTIHGQQINVNDPRHNRLSHVLHSPMTMGPM